MQHVVIIGNGIAGVTLARHLRKLSDRRITIISDETPYFFSRTALMYVFMGHMQFEHTQPYENWFWKKNRIDLLQARVQSIDFEAKKLLLENDQTFAYDKLVIATGSKPNFFNWPGQNLEGVSGLYHKQDLDKIEQLAPQIKTAVIVGGGLIGIELAEMLHSRGIHVYFLVREGRFWGNVLPEGESKIIENHILEHKIYLKLNSKLKEIIGSIEGKVTGILTESGEQIACDFVGICVGVSPNIGFLKSSELAIGKGVLVNKFLETNMPDVYAIGDCAEQTEPLPNRKPIEAVWYTGRMMGETLAQTLAGRRIAYQPSFWFNSAKFLDIEYQTYGTVSAVQSNDEQHFFWRHPKGKMCINIAYNPKTKAFLGINTLGIRLRHAYFDEALRKEKSLESVLEKFQEANFDPEFYKQYASELIVQYNQQFHGNLKLKSFKHKLSSFFK